MVAHAHRPAANGQRQPDVLRLTQVATVPAVTGEDVGRGLGARQGDDIGRLGLVGRVVTYIL